MNLPFNRKLIITVKIEYKSGISTYSTLQSILKYYDFESAKLIKISSEYNKVLEKEYKEELKRLKEKYKIPDKKDKNV